VVYVDVGANSYPVYVKAGILSDVGRITRDKGIKKALIVTDNNVGPLYLKKVQSALVEAGLKAFPLTLPAGESYKTISAVELIWEAALEATLDRKSLLISLGGGVIGDLTGFAAATYMRGLNFLQIPTTLLAQVDASVGGKTGCNLRKGKNLVGAFHQPIAVCADPSTLLSLSEREYCSGFAEIIKHALIASSHLLELVENNLDLIKKRDLTILTQIVEENVEIKAKIVSQDEKETGKRALLNLGHTAGHALEELGDYKIYHHGEAVAIGLVIATQIACERGYLDSSYLSRIQALLCSLGLPISPHEEISPEIWWKRTFADKKQSSGQVYWVLPKVGGLANYGEKVEFNEFAKAVRSLGKG